MLLPSRPRAELVARLVPHDNASWDDASDLALLQLRAPVNLSTAPRPVCLPHPEHYFLPGSRCRLARWGRGGEQGAVPGWTEAAGLTPKPRWRALFSVPEPAPGPNAQLEAELLGGWWCHCLYGRQGASVPPPGDPPRALCPAYQEEEEAGGCWVRGGCAAGAGRPGPEGRLEHFGAGPEMGPGRRLAPLHLGSQRILKRGLTSCAD